MELVIIVIGFLGVLLTVTGIMHRYFGAMHSSVERQREDLFRFLNDSSQSTPARPSGRRIWPKPSPRPLPSDVHCIFCHEDLLRDEGVSCRRCQGTYHVDCLVASGGCENIGCQRKREPRDRVRN